ncbi:hypothetical protein JBKA6_0519 [Ichthyobacterium seriolicida]|uniref:Transposase DDE domain-containing protein n=1 Tax=Ichthyobacterium seriolicida TaxID=242600 RepID=A0A1J1E3B5_9FLAO|nr:hypothetical protein JBKA6_0519 [Ichthyobacterium seriolicida]
MKVFLAKIFGKLFVDKMIDKLLLGKRSIIKTINDKLKNICQI